MCTDCFNGCGDELSSDQCIKYTGPDSTPLGVCTGNNLSLVESAIISTIEQIKLGEGITIDGITGCNSILSLLADSPPTLTELIQALYTRYCSLNSAVTTLQSENTSYAFALSCLTGLTSTSSRDDILQAVITLLCSVDTSVTDILNDYVKASDLNTLISNYLSAINNTTIVNNYTKMVPYVAYEYYGPLSNFDSGGKGLLSAGFDKVYLCNGSNGTPDKRGRVAVGAVNGVPGGALDAAVDPTLPANVGSNYSLKDKFGSINTILSLTQIPSHIHTIIDPGHFHGLNPPAGRQQVHRGGDTGYAYRTEDYPSAASTTSSTTGITINSAGGSQPHSNVQPSIAAYFIMYLP